MNYRYNYENTEKTNKYLPAEKEIGLHKRAKIVTSELCY